MAISPIALTRISTLQQSNAAQQTLTRTQQSLLQVENEISTGQSVNTPSDNPAAAAVIQQLQQTMATRTAYSDNLNQSASQLGEADSTLGDLGTLLTQAQNIASSNVGSDSTAAQRQAAAAVVSSLYDQAINIANTQFGGSYLFGGDRANQAPFTQTSAGLVYNGSPTTLQNTVDTDTNLAFQVNGDAVFGALSTQVQGNVNLAPAATMQTRLSDVNGATGDGVNLGSIQIGNGATTALVNLSGADTLGDVVNAINAAGVSGVGASLAGGGLQLTASGGANITVKEVGGGETAQDLGILTPTPAGANATVSGQNIGAKVTALTPLAALNNGAGIDLPGLTITNGATSTPISLSSASTVEDLLNAVNGSKAGVQASINAAGTGINIVNTVQGSVMTISENGGTTAAELGVRSFSPSTPLSQLNGGTGVQTAASGADFEVQRTDGSTFDVTLGSASTVQDVIDAINTSAAGSGGGVTASFATTGNGIVLTDTSGGAGALSVKPLNNSMAAAQLGLETTASGSVLQGTDVNGVTPQGIFADLGALRDALNSSNQAGITAAAQSLQADSSRVTVIQGQTGAQEQEVTSFQGRLTSDNEAAQTLLSSLQDTDMTTAITQFQALQTSLQAELMTQARSLSLSLLDFLA